MISVGVKRSNKLLAGAVLVSLFNNAAILCVISDGRGSDQTVEQESKLEALAAATGRHVVTFLQRTQLDGFCLFLVFLFCCKLLAARPQRAGTDPQLDPDPDPDLWHVFAQPV